MLQEHEGGPPPADLGVPQTLRSAIPASSPDGHTVPGATTTCSLERILGLLEVVGFEIDQFMNSHTLPGEKDDEVALSWMSTALEDMSATLIGVSNHPRHRHED